MGVIFPLSVVGKVVLIIIAITLGIIWSMLQFPAFWKRVLRKGKKSKILKDDEPENEKKK